MATSQSTVDYLLDQLSSTGAVSARKMFGEYCLYWAGKPIALICDDQLFLKPTNAAKDMIGDVCFAAPYPGAKPHFLISADQWEESEFLSELLQATADELPLPKPRKRKTK